MHEASTSATAAHHISVFVLELVLHCIFKAGDTQAPFTIVPELDRACIRVLLSRQLLTVLQSNAQVTADVTDCFVHIGFACLLY